MADNKEAICSLPNSINDKLDDKRTGICLIKPEYIIEGNVRHFNNEHSKEVDDKDRTDRSDGLDSEPERKRMKENCKKNKPRGQNKGRKLPFKTLREDNLCPWIANLTAEEAAESNECPNNACTFIHDRLKYLEIKPADVATECYIFKNTGKCQRGAACRFGSLHTTQDGYNIVDKEKYEAYQRVPPSVKNYISKDIVEKLKEYKYDFTKAEKIVSSFNWKTNKLFDKSLESVENVSETESSEKKVGAISDAEEIKLRPRERKRIDWKDKIMLAPLTTVGNLPFRRICKEYGAEITCGEMAMAAKLLKGMREEQALVKRHKTEDIFGVQITGNNPGVLTRCAQLLNDEIDVDFLDLNLACPIDLVYREGAGCRMLTRPQILESVVQSCSKVLDIPLTIKMRTAVYVDSPIAHTLVPKFKKWGVSMINIHGRSREQRYTKLANWDYIEECAKAAEPIPVYGTGDILSYDDYARIRATYPTVQGVSIARGALIKPWIFQEIKERRLIDISASERFDMLKRYTNYGLEHWGSDTRGVENTRRFMLEWISFLYRYVPVGILKDPPQRMNNRPPYYRGRNELETLMASPNCADWVKLSEMLLGKTPDGFNFIPKHKANAWN